MRRRDALMAIGAAAALPNGVLATAPSPSPSLDSLARRGGRRFGSCIAAGGLGSGSIGDPGYARLVAAECGLVVPENEMKWQALRPSPGRFDFTRCDRIAAWTRAHGLALRGHTLLWHRPKWMPAWVNDHDFGVRPASTAEALVTEHIRAVMCRYGNVASCWDVVNEAVNDEADGLVETSLSRAIGSIEQTLDLAFHAAREQAPHARLVYNDYMSWEPYYASHRAQVLKLLEGFRKRGTPVDALGIQSHIEMFSIDPETGTGPYAEREWRAFLDEVVAMGYTLLITEFDVKDKALPTGIVRRDAGVGDYARRYFDIMLSYPQLGDVLCWGLVDACSWLQGFAPRKDGLEVRGTPYDSDYRAKPLRTAIAQAFAQAVREA